MATYAKVEESRATKPARVVHLPPSAFADTWPDRPTSSVAIGLRFISQADNETARGEAAKKAWALHPEPDDEEVRSATFNDALLEWICARGTCDPENVSLGWLAAQDDQIRRALRPEGVRELFEAWERWSIETDPTGEQADADDVAALAVLLADDRLSQVARGPARRARRLVSALLEILREEPAASDVAA